MTRLAASCRAKPRPLPIDPCVGASMSCLNLLSAWRMKTMRDIFPLPSWRGTSTECPWCLELHSGWSDGRQLLIVKKAVLAVLIGKNESKMPPAPSWKWVSTESLRFRVLHHEKWYRYVTGIIHKSSFDGFCRQQSSTNTILQLCKWNQLLVFGRQSQEYTLPICLHKLPNHCL